MKKLSAFLIGLALMVPVLSFAQVATTTFPADATTEAVDPEAGLKAILLQIIALLQQQIQMILQQQGLQQEVAGLPQPNTAGMSETQIDQSTPSVPEVVTPEKTLVKPCLKIPQSRGKFRYVCPKNS